MYMRIGLVLAVGVLLSATAACGETDAGPTTDGSATALTCASEFEPEAATHEATARLAVGELVDGLLCRYAPAGTSGRFALHSEQALDAEMLDGVKQGLLSSVPFDPRAADCEEATAVALVVHLREQGTPPQRVTAGGHGNGLGCATLHGQGRQFESYPLWEALHSLGLMEERLYVSLPPPVVRR
jgi:hypothetical protein